MHLHGTVTVSGFRGLIAVIENAVRSTREPWRHYGAIVVRPEFDVPAVAIITAGHRGKTAEHFHTFDRHLEKRA